MSQKPKIVGKMLFMAVILLTLVSVVQISLASTPCSVTWFAEDTVTKGDWYYNPVGSPIGVYGSYAYILPNPPVNRTEVPIGNFSVPVGGFSELPDPPYSWTSSQMAGLPYHKPNPTYWDEYYSQTPEVLYNVEGTRICTDSRALTDGTYRKAACYFGDSFSVDIDLTSGTYQLSMYLIDWDSYARAEITALTSDGVTTSVVVEDFHEGVYEKFFVHIPTDQTVTLTITKTEGANGLISGIFLDSTVLTPGDPLVTEINYLGDDWATQGDWIGVYGSLGYILSGWNAALKTPLIWDPSYDMSGGVLFDNYTVSGKVYAWTGLTPLCIQYPMFEWGWYGFHSTQTEPREVYYPIEGAWRLAAWDDGSERCKPTHASMNYNMFFPEGTYLLSLYAYDYEVWARESMEYIIYDMFMNELARKRISGTAFDEGIYEIFKVEAPPEGCVITVQLYNDEGHPVPNLNILLSGIFVDKVEPVCGHTIGFWKTNAAKDLKLNKGKAQVNKADYLALLDCVDSTYSSEIGDWAEWNISSPSDVTDLKWALHWLSYGAYQPGTNSWDNPDASNPLTKARAQLLSLLLTACYKGTNYTDAWISVPGYNVWSTVSEWIEEIFYHYNMGHYKIVYKLANYLNENCALNYIEGQQLVKVYEF